MKFLVDYLEIKGFQMLSLPCKSELSVRFYGKLSFTYTNLDFEFAKILSLGLTVERFECAVVHLRKGCFNSSNG